MPALAKVGAKSLSPSNGGRRHVLLAVNQQKTSATRARTSTPISFTISLGEFLPKASMCPSPLKPASIMEKKIFRWSPLFVEVRNQPLSALGMVHAANTNKSDDIFRVPFLLQIVLHACLLEKRQTRQVRSRTLPNQINLPRISAFSSNSSPYSPRTQSPLDTPSTISPHTPCSGFL